MRWRVASGKLPFGLRLNTQNGKLIGTARRAGTYRFTLEVTDRFESPTRRRSSSPSASNDDDLPTSPNGPPQGGPFAF